VLVGEGCINSLSENVIGILLVLWFIVNLEESSNTHGGLGILEIPSSIVNSFFLSILSLSFPYFPSITAVIRTELLHKYFAIINPNCMSDRRTIWQYM
jgi:ABC-type dipeptide/oligopeptide/nickel transport system permease component